jgi:hypothetical protein
MGSRFTVHGSRFTVRGLQFAAGPWSAYRLVHAREQFTNGTYSTYGTYELQPLTANGER